MSMLTWDIGANAIEETDPNKEQLVKGFQAQFWFSFASAIICALLALTLKIGRRGTHDEIREDQMTRKAQEEKDAAELQSAKQSIEDKDPTENTIWFYSTKSPRRVVQYCHIPE
jgi:hypothetical protein